MKTSTLFRAYVIARNRMEWAVGVRGSEYGICVRDDKYAREWQRYDRIARRTEKAIVARLEE